MTQPLTARMYLSEQRKTATAPGVQTSRIFAKGNDLAEDEATSCVDEVTLLPGGFLNYTAVHSGCLLLPLVGGLEYHRAQKQDFVLSGQALFLPLFPGESIRLSNPYEWESVTFLLVKVTRSDTFPAGQEQVCSVDLSLPNRLQALVPAESGAGFTGEIGIFAGREEGVYAVRLQGEEARSKEVFVLVLQGVFEVANRLLHPKDGLALQFQQESVVEFEALSNNAILLFLELP